jgi:hypothetical protein
MHCIQGKVIAAGSVRFVHMRHDNMILKMAMLQAVA